MGSRAKLSAAVLGLVLAGAPASVILDQFLNEKEGNSLTAYKDGGGIWTICRGATTVDGKPVTRYEAIAREMQSGERQRAEQGAGLGRPQYPGTTDRTAESGIASFCPYNIGPGKCFPSTFINASTPVIVKGHVKQSAGGLKTVAVIAD
jgi:lysozyme